VSLFHTLLYVEVCGFTMLLVTLTPCSYQQYFDLEGDTGIVVRGIGTCVSLALNLQSSFPAAVQSLAQGGILKEVVHASNLGLFKESETTMAESGGKGVGGGSASGGGEASGAIMASPKNLALCKTSSSGSEGFSGSPNRGSGQCSCCRCCVYVACTFIVYVDPFANKTYVNPLPTIILNAQSMYLD